MSAFVALLEGVGDEVGEDVPAAMSVKCQQVPWRHREWLMDAVYRATEDGPGDRLS